MIEEKITTYLFIFFMLIFVFLLPLGYFQDKEIRSHNEEMMGQLEGELYYSTNQRNKLYKRYTSYLENQIKEKEKLYGY